MHRDKDASKSRDKVKGSTSVPDPDAAGEQGPGWNGNAVALAEYRDKAVHSSQQKIKVVLA